MEQMLQPYIPYNFCLTNYTPDIEGDYCNSTADGMSCFPPTPAGSVARHPCPSFALIGIDSTQNATRMCYKNATWESKTNYSLCHPSIPEDGFHEGIVSTIYYAGFSLSTAALIVALFIFVRYRSLRCLRNAIHCHLISSFICRNLLWFCTFEAVLEFYDHQAENFYWFCKALVVLFNYFHVTNFFWMFIEGLYLFTICMWTFSVEKIKLWYYVAIAWGIPGVVIIIWAITKWKYEDSACWVTNMFDSHSYDLIFIAPSLFVLFLNVIFLASIIWILITRLKSSKTIQTRHSRKAAQALLVLVPLFGLTWLVFIVPVGDHVIAQLVFKYCNVVLQSTQGLLVAVILCFLNSEVRRVINMRFNRWKMKRNNRAARSSRGIVVFSSVSLGFVRLQRKDRHSSSSIREELKQPHTKDLIQRC